MNPKLIMFIAVVIISVLMISKTILMYYIKDKTIRKTTNVFLTWSIIIVAIIGLILMNLWWFMTR